MTECVITVEHIRRNPSSIVSDSENFFMAPAPSESSRRRLESTINQRIFRAYPSISLLSYYFSRQLNRTSSRCTLISICWHGRTSFEDFFFVNLGTGNSFFFSFFTKVVFVLGKDFLTCFCSTESRNRRMLVTHIPKPDTFVQKSFYALTSRCESHSR